MESSEYSQIFVQHGWGEQGAHSWQLDDRFGLYLRLSRRFPFLVLFVHIQMLCDFGYFGPLGAARAAYKNLVRAARGLVAEVPLAVP